MSGAVDFNECPAYTGRCKMSADTKAAPEDVQRWRCIDDGKFAGLEQAIGGPWIAYYDYERLLTRNRALEGEKAESESSIPQSQAEETK